jgi:mRNA interferase RelE/StbE
LKIELVSKALKELKKIDKFQAKKIFNKIKELEHYPDTQNVKKLTNYTPTHRLRVGNYRILFSIQDDTIIIGEIKHRKEAY